jgi:hypothetical protein
MEPITTTPSEKVIPCPTDEPTWSYKQTITN